VLLLTRRTVLFERRPWAMAAALLLAGVVLSMIIAGATDALRHAIFPFPIRRAGPPSAPRGSPLWSFTRVWVVNDFFVYLGVLAAGLARGFSLRDQARRREASRQQALGAAREARLAAELAQARLEALRMQLDPHFLFNTLNAISSLVERDPRGVRRIISRLSELLRHSINGANEQEIPLRTELALLDRYLEIMRIRFQGQLSVEMQIAPETLDALVPNLILQPLAENALKHGAAQGTAARIQISARRVNDQLVLAIRDNGPGPAGSSANQPAHDGGLHVERREGSGVGLTNTRARLEHLYGDAQRFTLRALDPASERKAAPGETGAVAEIVLPFRLSEQAPAGGAPASSTGGTRD
jgi:two-component sensor histidine kinase